MAELDGRVAIVTGAGQGIGEQVARKLSQAGAKVLVSDIDADRAESVAADLAGDGAAHAGDLTSSGVPEDAVATAVDHWGRLDIVVNNAGYAWDGPIHKVTDDQFQAMLDIHTV